jgi:predicted MPP superfamily phosphohydrolase
MGIGFVHLSDIHFGQEKGGEVKIHDDIKECLIDDVRLVAESLESGRAAGIIVTGDIAYGGRVEEYKAAADWLDKVAEAAGCNIFDIQVVPGNHDINRDEITPLTEMMLEKIVAEGESALDSFLNSDPDRDLLFRRFSAYRPFASGYRCTLDTKAEPAEERVVELASGRSIRFIRLNSALACSNNDEKGKLLLGARQRVLKPGPGEELIVLSHHPVHWFQDSKEVWLYISNRVRVFISGHEHNPSVKIKRTEEGSDLMMLAAGATVPPNFNDRFNNYCYNFIEFDWDEEKDALSVCVQPRTWINAQKRFAADNVQLGHQGSKFILGCPKFRKTLQEKNLPTQEVVIKGASDTVTITAPDDHAPKTQEEEMVDTYPLLLLRFFRDISQAQRISILVSLGALPPNWSGVLSESIERKALDSLVKAGRSEELWAEFHKIVQQ